MAYNREVVTIYSAGVVQGFALVTFPAASAVFTSPNAYGLSSTEYGGMFVPQAIMAIAASLLGAELTERLGTKRIYMLGLLANLLAMTLLVGSRFVMQEHALAYGTLLLATACMGTGFGCTVPALNTFAAAFFPKKINEAVQGLNALLGLGTALAPVFIALFVGIGIWWGLPAFVGVLLIGLLLLSKGEILGENDTLPREHARKPKSKFPARFWIFAAFVLLYGICETMNGNWASLYMTKHFGAGTAVASLALTMFWSMVAAGRVLCAILEKWVPEKIVCRVLPFAVATAFISGPCASRNAVFLGFFTFALAGLGCSALLPLALSLGHKELTTISASVAAGLIAFYQIGYGLAAFGVGPLQTRTGLTLNTIYGGTAAVAVAMAALSFFVTRKPSAAA